MARVDGLKIVGGKSLEVLGYQKFKK